MGVSVMTDRERVLMNIAVDTAGSVCDSMERLEQGWCLRFTFGSPSPQFIPTTMAEAIRMPMKPGDIVRCKTNPNHRWGIAELAEQPIDSYSDHVLREIGGDRICRMGNESFDVLRFMSPSRLYTGTKYRIHRWATVKAFSERYNPDGDYYKRCGGVEFDGDRLTIWCRSHIFSMERVSKDGETQYAQPKKFMMKWSDKTRLKDIVATMQEQGFADEFEYGPDEPTKGQSGYAKFTRKDIIQVLQPV